MSGEEEKQRKKKKRDEDAELWEDWAQVSDGFDYSSGTATKKKKKSKNAEEPTQPKDPLAGYLEGVVKSQSFNSGNFFLQCSVSFEKYGRDVTVFYDEMPEGIEVGDAVLFRMAPPRHVDAPPTAWKVKKATGEMAAEIQERCRKERMSEKGSKGKGKGGGFKGKNRGPTISMTGVVKKKSAITGRHFIFCQDISDVCGQDAQIPEEEMPQGVELKCGDRISFEVEEPDETRLACPLAFNIRLLSGRAAAKRKQGDEVAEDGEDEEEVEMEEEDDGGVEEPDVDAQDVADADVSGRLEAEGEEDAGGDDREQDEWDGDDGTQGGDPTSVQGWVAVQKRLFKGLPALAKDWIRMRSKSSGLIYFYNVKTGESSAAEPIPQLPETVEEWTTAQKELFPGMPKLPRGWIRMRSRSTKLVFYYNVETGESTPNEPSR